MRAKMTNAAVMLLARMTPYVESELLGLANLVGPGSVCLDVGAAAGLYSLQSDWVATNSFTTWMVPVVHWEIGGTFLIAALSALAGVAAFAYMRVTSAAYFRGDTLTRTSPALVFSQEL